MDKKIKAAIKFNKKIIAEVVKNGSTETRLRATRVFIDGDHYEGMNLVHVSEDRHYQVDLNDYCGQAAFWELSLMVDGERKVIATEDTKQDCLNIIENREVEEIKTETDANQEVIESIASCFPIDTPKQRQAIFYIDECMTKALSKMGIECTSDLPCLYYVKKTSQHHNGNEKVIDLDISRAAKCLIEAHKEIWPIAYKAIMMHNQAGETKK